MKLSGLFGTSNNCIEKMIGMKPPPHALQIGTIEESSLLALQGTIEESSLHQRDGEGRLDRLRNGEHPAARSAVEQRQHTKTYEILLLLAQLLLVKVATLPGPRSQLCQRR